MNNFKTALFGVMISLGCSIAVANSNDDHAAADKPAKPEAGTDKPASADAPAKTVQKKKAARSSKKTAAALKDDAGKADQAHGAEPDAPPAAPPIAKRVLVRDRTSLAKAVNVLNPVSNTPVAAMSDNAPDDAASHDASSNNSHSATATVAQADEAITHAAEAPKADQSSYSLVDRHPAEYVRPVGDVTDRPTEPVRQTNFDGARLNETSNQSAEPARNTAESSMACTPPSKTEIAALFDRWNKSLRTGDPKKVVANYAPYSVLLPTVSNKARFTTAEKEDYFQHFLERKPVGKIDDRLIEVDCRSASDAGLYTFSFSDGSVVKARYSFAYKKIGDEWLISSHHSSGMPEKPEASVTAAKVAVHEKPAVKTAERSQAREDFHNEIPTRAQGWVRYP